MITGESNVLLDNILRLPMVARRLPVPIIKTQPASVTAAPADSDEDTVPSKVRTILRVGTLSGNKDAGLAKTSSVVSAVSRALVAPQVPVHTGFPIGKALAYMAGIGAGGYLGEKLYRAEGTQATQEQLAQLRGRAQAGEISPYVQKLPPVHKEAPDLR